MLGLNDADSDDEDANLLDPGQEEANSSETGDESPLLFRMLSTRSRRSRNRRTTRRQSNSRLSDGEADPHLTLNRVNLSEQASADGAAMGAQLSQLGSGGGLAGQSSLEGMAVTSTTSSRPQPRRERSNRGNRSANSGTAATAGETIEESASAPVLSRPRDASNRSTAAHGSSSRRSRESSSSSSRENSAIQMLVSPLDFTRTMRNAGSMFRNSLTRGRSSSSTGAARSAPEGSSSSYRRSHHRSSRWRRVYNVDGISVDDQAAFSNQNHNLAAAAGAHNTLNQSSSSNQNTNLTISSPSESRQILIAQRMGLIQHLPLVSWSGRDLKAKINADASNNHVDGINCSSRRERAAQRRQAAVAEEEFVQERGCPSPPSYSEKVPPASSGLVNEWVPSQHSSSVSTPPQKHKTTAGPTSSENNTNEPQASSSSKINPITDITDLDYEESKSSESDEYECTICLEEFQTGQKIRYLPCMHYYHAGCIDAWLMKSFTCPRCMAAVDSGIMTSFAQQLS